MIQAKHIKTGNVTFGNDLPFTLIAGPCQMETRDHAMMMAEKLVEITSRLGIDFIYKSSFDKANRTTPHQWQSENEADLGSEIGDSRNEPCVPNHGQKSCCWPSD